MEKNERQESGIVVDFDEAGDVQRHHSLDNLADTFTGGSRRKKKQHGRKTAER